MAKRTGKICPPVENEKNFLIEVPDDSIVIIVPRTNPIKTRGKKHDKPSVEEIYMKRVAMAKAIAPLDNNNSDDGSNGPDPV